MLPCLFKYFTNFDCPGCGIQRSLLLLLNGKVAESIAMYWATIPIIIMFGYLLLFLVFRFRNGWRHLIFLFSFNSILIFCHYFYKLSHLL